MVTGAFVQPRDCPNNHSDTSGFLTISEGSVLQFCVLEQEVTIFSQEGKISQLADDS